MNININQATLTQLRISQTSYAIDLWKHFDFRMFSLHFLIDMSQMLLSLNYRISFGEIINWEIIDSKNQWFLGFIHVWILNLAVLVINLSHLLLKFLLLICRLLLLRLKIINSQFFFLFTFFSYEVFFKISCFFMIIYLDLY